MTLIAVAVLLVVIAVGIALIHRLNAQHNERIADFHYSDALPGIGRRHRRHHRPAADRTTDTPPQDSDRG
ncbi:hypothetical protein [Streptomyces sp. NPDC051636]|uniref:hypothetical protein n=1 Tax=Streptomyces sp. NPDC051636 TaxID=3365663 RepID=UPI0037B574BB